MEVSTSMYNTSIGHSPPDQYGDSPALEEGEEAAAALHQSLLMDSGGVSKSCCSPATLLAVVGRRRRRRRRKLGHDDSLLEEDGARHGTSSSTSRYLQVLGDDSNGDPHGNDLLGAPSPASDDHDFWNTAQQEIVREESSNNGIASPREQHHAGEMSFSLSSSWRNLRRNQQPRNNKSEASPSSTSSHSTASSSTGSSSSLASSPNHEYLQVLGDDSHGDPHGNDLEHHQEGNDFWNTAQHEIARDESSNNDMTSPREQQHAGEMTFSLSSSWRNLRRNQQPRTNKSEACPSSTSSHSTASSSTGSSSSLASSPNHEFSYASSQKRIAQLAGALRIPSDVDERDNMEPTFPEELLMESAPPPTSPSRKKNHKPRGILKKPEELLMESAPPPTSPSRKKNHKPRGILKKTPPAPEQSRSTTSSRNFNNNQEDDDASSAAYSTTTGYTTEYDDDPSLASQSLLLVAEVMGNVSSIISSSSSKYSQYTMEPMDSSSSNNSVVRFAESIEVRRATSTTSVSTAATRSPLNDVILIDNGHSDQEDREPRHTHTSSTAEELAGSESPATPREPGRSFVPAEPIEYENVNQNESTETPSSSSSSPSRVRSILSSRFARRNKSGPRDRRSPAISSSPLPIISEQECATVDAQEVNQHYSSRLRTGDPREKMFKIDISKKSHEKKKRFVLFATPLPKISTTDHVEETDQKETFDTSTSSHIKIKKQVMIDFQSGNEKNNSDGDEDDAVEVSGFLEGRRLDDADTVESQPSLQILQKQPPSTNYSSDPQHVPETLILPDNPRQTEINASERGTAPVGQLTTTTTTHFLGCHGTAPAAAQALASQLLSSGGCSGFSVMARESSSVAGDYYDYYYNQDDVSTWGDGS
eukprot:CAMPEP_0172473760 /NCGR_PEP_ID=MMETSP1065-20121228/69019_1 /TAXON_ID=265537 /ORGANISM="Amphiprora paludosa, Strain CCMP125" /LENGTH=874 /DNA_ID=CAMNT_0013231937 /DNA_START=90 /DNA_END=2711 /DNA_ORIENTATION=+